MSASGHEIEACVRGQHILIFEGLSKVHAVQHHSLHAILGHQDAQKKAVSPHES